MDFLLGGIFFLGSVWLISSALSVLGLLFSKKGGMTRETLTSFECGFDPLSSSRDTFSLRFFILAVVFLIFDVELVLLIPFIISIYWCVSLISKVLLSSFVLILILGLIHELNEGSLDWSV